MITVAMLSKYFQACYKSVDRKNKCKKKKSSRSNHLSFTSFASLKSRKIDIKLLLLNMKFKFSYLKILTS